MTTVRRTFLHFFDIHFLEEKGVKHIPQKIYFEAFFATRFSLLCSEKVFIPASSYFESLICRKIVDQYLNIVPYGIIWLIGQAHSYSEFCQNKIYQYSNSPEHISSYKSALKSDISFPFYRRKRSSTEDIKANWIQKLNFSEVPTVFDDCQGFIVPLDIEEKWNNIPEKLKDNAFIVPNVVPLLFGNEIDNLSVINNLHELINKSYFLSYITELDASIVTDMVNLESNYDIANHSVNIPYSYLLNELNLRNKIDLVKNLRPEELLAFRETEEWIDIFNSSLSKKHIKISNICKYHGIDFLQKSFEVIPKQQIILFNEVNMGDTYVAGQVAAQGPNAHAENITFNQLWNQNQDRFHFDKLEKEIATLRIALKNEAESPEQLSELGLVANAEIEVKKRNGPKALEWLSKTGKWTLSVAEKISVSIVSDAIKSSLGL